MALITTDDIESRLVRDLTVLEAVRVEAIIPDAEASIRSYTGQTFTEEETTDRLKIRNGFVRLPQHPVTEVDTVEDTNGNEVSFTWDGLERVYVPGQVPDTFSFEPYRTRLSLVDVTYTHGYETPPADIVGVLCGIVMRSLGQSPEDSGIVQESIDGYSYRLGTAGAAAGFGLLPDERRILDKYRRQGGTVRVAL